MLKKVVFLDRDGVINFDSLSYIKNLEEFIFIPGSLSAICKLSRYGYSVFVITNQSGIARKLIAKHELDKIHHYLIDSIHKAGGSLGGIYFCPHHPDQGCNCRKPRPGLIHQAAKENHIDIFSSIMIGDKYTDIECARRAGCKCAYFVMTGIEKNRKLKPKNLSRYFYRDVGTLFHAVDIIIAEDEAKLYQY
ncbi:MAG: D-glycero-beta-D-manno-heptose 1,7-bisphosphate 7-phosphatase [Desulfobacterales bacterium]